MCLRQAGAWPPPTPGRLFIFPFPGSIRLAGQAAMAIRRGASLGCRRGPAAGAAGGGDIGNLQPLENPVGKCSLRDVLAKAPPLRSGDVPAGHPPFAETLALGQARTGQGRSLAGCRDAL